MDFGKLLEEMTKGTKSEEVGKTIASVFGSLPEKKTEETDGLTIECLELLKKISSPDDGSNNFAKDCVHLLSKMMDAKPRDGQVTVNTATKLSDNDHSGYYHTVRVVDYYRKIRKEWIDYSKETGEPSDQQVSKIDDDIKNLEDVLESITDRYPKLETIPDPKNPLLDVAYRK